MPGTEDGPHVDYASAVIGAALRCAPSATRSGSADLAAGASVRASAREGATWPRSWTVSPISPAHGLVVPVFLTHSLDDFASLPEIRATGPNGEVPQASP
jgi:hypothetical protein